MIASSRASCESSSAYRRARTNARLPAANTATISASTPACHNVRRARTLSVCIIAWPDEEADAADGAQELALVGLVELAAQPRDGDVDHVIERRGARAHVPDVARQHLARDGAAAMSQQVLDDVVLARRDLEQAPAARYLVREAIEHQVLALERGALLGAPAAQERSDARQHLGEREGLYQI